LFGLAGPSRAGDRPADEPSFPVRAPFTADRLAAAATADQAPKDLEEMLGFVLDRGKMLLDKASEGLAGLSLRLKEARGRRRAINDLKQIALAAHNYASANNDQIFPYAITDNKGKALLSWRVFLLPYVEEDNLYKQFKLDEPWDSAHNKKLLPLMPKVYAPAMGREKDSHKTYYRVFTGPEAVFDVKGKNRYTIANIPDGTSNTVMVAEAGEAVPWTKPDELSYNPKADLPKLGGQFRDVFLVAMFDGSVRAVRRSVREQTLRDAITPDDGNVLGDF